MKALFHFLIVLSLAFLLWGLGFLVFSYSSVMMKPEAVNEPSDAIVVLTGGKERIQTGLALFAAGKSNSLMISGVHPDVPIADILALRNGKPDLPKCCISIGHKATNTVENAQETKDWIEEKGFKSIRLVTSDYHMHRASMEMAHAMPSVKIMRHPVKQPNLRPHQRHFWEILFEEYHKVIFRWLSILFEKLAYEETQKAPQTNPEPAGP